MTCRSKNITIENLGGAIPATEKGFFQKEIAEAAYRYQKEVDQKQRIIVGVNEFVEGEKQELELRKIDPDELNELERRFVNGGQIHGQQRIPRFHLGGREGEDSRVGAGNRG